MATNILKGIGIEFHILQSFPVTCLNRDDVGAPKSALVGGVPRARVSSQCWKRQVRLALHDLGLSTGIRTKRLAEMIADACLAAGSGASGRLCGGKRLRAARGGGEGQKGQERGRGRYGQGRTPQDRAGEDQKVPELCQECCRRAGHRLVRPYGSPGSEPERAGRRGLCPCPVHPQSGQ